MGLIVFRDTVDVIAIANTNERIISFIALHGNKFTTVTLDLGDDGPRIVVDGRAYSACSVRYADLYSLIDWQYLGTEMVLEMAIHEARRGVYWLPRPLPEAAVKVLEELVEKGVATTRELGYYLAGSWWDIDRVRELLRDPRYRRYTTEMVIVAPNAMIVYATYTVPEDCEQEYDPDYPSHGTRRCGGPAYPVVHYILPQLEKVYTVYVESIIDKDRHS